MKKLLNISICSLFFFALNAENQQVEKAIKETNADIIAPSFKNFGLLSGTI